MNMKEWEKTDLWKFTSEHQDCEVESWGGYIGKGDGYTPFGFSVTWKNKILTFGLDGHYINTRAL